jgi:hypothetical protein
VLPAGLAADLGYDAVGTPRDHGERILARLPRAGCVYADDLRWWRLVPPGSDIGVVWPPSTGYVTGAHCADPSWTRTRPRPAPGPLRLVHASGTGSPYTPPIPLYLATCRLAGSLPRWTLNGAAR